ncbi:hypothetical protein HDV00_008661 [Rhizophlyctis rosea]|nr:hypothetical protein HDV00_008661 [Rhizophlyctis rosea]
MSRTANNWEIASRVEDNRSKNGDGMPALSKSSSLGMGRKGSLWDDSKDDGKPQKGLGGAAGAPDTISTLPPKGRRASIALGQISRITQPLAGDGGEPREGVAATTSHRRRTSDSSPGSTLRRPSLTGANTSDSASSISSRTLSSRTHSKTRESRVGSLDGGVLNEEEEYSPSLDTVPASKSLSLEREGSRKSNAELGPIRNKSSDLLREEHGRIVGTPIRGRANSLENQAPKSGQGRRRSSLSSGLDYDAVLSGKFDNNPAALLGYLTVPQSRGSSSGSLSPGAASRSSSRDRMLEEAVIETDLRGKTVAHLNRPRQSVTADTRFEDSRSSAGARSGSALDNDSGSGGPVPRSRRRMSLSAFNALQINSLDGRRRDREPSAPLLEEDVQQDASIAAKKRWQWAITLTRKLLRSSSLFRHTAPDTAAGYLATLTQRDAIVNGDRLCTILATKVELRTASQLRQLDTLLCTMPTFARLPMDVRTELGKSAVYIAAGPGRLVIKEGRQPLFVYWMFTGVCTSSTEAPKAAEYEVKSYRAGETLGSFALTAPDQPRAATITTVTPTELVGVSCEAYINAMTGAGHQSYQLGMEHLLRSIPAFESTPTAILGELINAGQAVEFDLASTILSPPDRRFFYILLSGKCHTIRSIPLIRTTPRPALAPPSPSPPQRSSLAPPSPSPPSRTSLTPTDTPQTLTPQPPPTTAPTRSRRPSLKSGPSVPRAPPTLHTRAYMGIPPTDDEELIYETVSTGEIAPLEYFPPLRVGRGEVMDLKAAGVPAAKVRLVRDATKRHGRWVTKEGRVIESDGGGSGGDGEDRRFEDEQEKVAMALDLTVRALQRVECFRISRLDVLRILDEATVMRLVSRSNEGKVGASLQELQESFLTNRAWDEHRKKVVEQVITEGRNRRGSIQTF